jgi:hypothetical protein
LDEEMKYHIAKAGTIGRSAKHFPPSVGAPESLRAGQAQPLQNTMVVKTSQMELEENNDVTTH